MPDTEEIGRDRIRACWPGVGLLLKQQDPWSVSQNLDAEPCSSGDGVLWLHHLRWERVQQEECPVGTGGRRLHTQGRNNNLLGEDDLPLGGSFCFLLVKAMRCNLRLQERGSFWAAWAISAAWVIWAVWVSSLDQVQVVVTCPNHIQNYNKTV